MKMILAVALSFAATLSGKPAYADDELFASGDRFGARIQKPSKAVEFRRSTGELGEPFVYARGTEQTLAALIPKLAVSSGLRIVAGEKVSPDSCWLPPMVYEGSFGEFLDMVARHCRASWLDEDGKIMFIADGSK